MVRSLFSGRAPAGVQWNDSLCLAQMRVHSLPANLTIQGDLDLRQCQRLRRIGDGLKVAGDLRIGGRCAEPPGWAVALMSAAQTDAGVESGFFRIGQGSQCPLRSLPEGLMVDGGLWLSQCNTLTRFPSDFRVAGSLHIHNCVALTALPDPLTIEADLTIVGCRGLVALPDRLRVKGSLVLVGSHIRQLPPELYVGKDIVLERCDKLAVLPDGLHVGRDLVLRHCRLHRLPNRLSLDRHLLVDRCPALTDTPSELAVGRNARFIHCAQLQRVPAPIRVGHSLYFRHCPELHELASNQQVPGTLDLQGCTSLTTLPANLRIGSKLRLAGCSGVLTLPDDLHVGRAIDLRDSALRDLPPALAQRCRLLWHGLLIDAEVAFHPEQLTAERVLTERNAELRRVMLERAGVEQILAKADAKVVDSDMDAGGERRLYRVSQSAGEPSANPFIAARRLVFCYLLCQCPSTGRKYLLRVPPEMQTCRQAAAWMSGFENADDYRPILET